MRSAIVSLNQFQKRLFFYGFGGLNSILRNKLFLFWSESLRLSTRLKSKLSRMWMVLWCLDIYSVWIKSFLVSAMAFWHHFQKEIYFCGQIITGSWYQNLVQFVLLRKISWYVDTEMRNRLFLILKAIMVYEDQNQKPNYLGCEGYRFVAISELNISLDLTSVTVPPY